MVVGHLGRDRQEVVDDVPKAVPAARWMNQSGTGEILDMVVHVLPRNEGFATITANWFAIDRINGGARWRDDAMCV